MGVSLVMVALWAGCSEQNETEPPVAEEAPAAPAEAPEQPEAPAADAAMTLPERGADADRVSKNGELIHEVAGTKVTVRFGKPLVNGREIFGGLVPYGKVWRTGANEASVIAVDQNVMVQGQELPKGLYGLFTIPGEEEWTVIFNKNATQWGSTQYDESNDVLRVTATPEAAEATEAFDIQGTEEGIVLRWAEVAVPVSIAAAAGEAAPADEPTDDADAADAAGHEGSEH